MVTLGWDMFSLGSSSRTLASLRARSSCHSTGSLAFWMRHLPSQTIHPSTGSLRAHAKHPQASSADIWLTWLRFRAASSSQRTNGPHCAGIFRENQGTYVRTHPAIGSSCTSISHDLLRAAPVISMSAGHSYGSREYPTNRLPPNSHRGLLSKSVLINLQKLLGDDRTPITQYRQLSVAQMNCRDVSNSTHELDMCIKSLCPAVQEFVGILCFAQSANNTRKPLLRDCSEIRIGTRRHG